MTNDFDKNGYVHLKGFLDDQNCNELTNILKDLVKNGKTEKDDQCPKSEAIHGTITFDKLLEDLLPHFENICGKQLYPTYSYARLYKPGEELKKHTDRPSCEISVTVMWDSDGTKWPIYMDGTPVEMNKGDAVIYLGTEIEHWRENFEGDFHLQSFLHYVDKNGPYSEYEWDKKNIRENAKIL